MADTDKNESRKGPGRPPGARNKYTLEAEHRLKEMGYDALEWSVGIATGKIKFTVPVVVGDKVMSKKIAASPEIRSQHILKLVKLVYPERKAVELTGADNEGLKIIVETK